MIEKRPHLSTAQGRLSTRDVEREAVQWAIQIQPGVAGTFITEVGCHTVWGG